MPKNHALTEPVAQALQQMHPNTFIQTAAWNLYVYAPGLLDAAAYVKIAHAEGIPPTAMMERRTTTTQED